MELILHTVSTLNSFDRIAPVYDRLAGIVFGTAIQDAQRVHLGALGDAHEVLILGGGTGWLLKDLLRLHPVMRVMYVEASPRMIELAAKNVSDADRHRVAFIHGTERTLPEERRFDAVIVNFFVDMFPASELIEVLGKLNVVLRSGGRLLCTDFVNDTKWHNALLWMMYAFFRVTANLRNQHLAPWRKLIPERGFVQLRSTSFWKGFICSELYQKDSGSTL